MPTIEILGFAPSTFVRTARMVACEKGIDHVLKPLAFKTPEHLGLHPFGKMPVMLHGANRLTETIAIATYIDAAFAGPMLQPDDPLGRAQMWQGISVAVSEAYPTLVSAALGEGGAAAIDGEAAAVVLDWYDVSCGGAERLATIGPMLDDLFLCPIVDFHVSSAGRTVFSGRTRLGPWYEAMKARSSFKEVIGG